MRPTMRPTMQCYAAMRAMRRTMRRTMQGSSIMDSIMDCIALQSTMGARRRRRGGWAHGARERPGSPRAPIRARKAPRPAAPTRPPLAPLAAGHHWTEQQQQPAREGPRRAWAGWAAFEPLSSGTCRSGGAVRGEAHRGGLEVLHSGPRSCGGWPPSKGRRRLRRARRAPTPCQTLRRG